VKYTIALSPEFIEDLPLMAELHAQPDGDKYKAFVSVDDAEGNTLNVPIRAKVDSTGCLYFTFDDEIIEYKRKR